MVSNRLIGAFCGACLLSASLCGTASEYGSGIAAPYVAQSIVAGDALHDADGVITLNLATGDANLQVNAVAIALNLGSNVGIASVSGFQLGGERPNAVSQATVVRIESRAFVNATGLILVNQASGQANVQANTVAIALGIDGEALTENLLAQAVAPADRGSDLSTRGSQKISVDETAFKGARGIVQLNQSAGSGNAMLNSFTLRLSINAER